MAIYLFIVKTFFSFVIPPLIKREGLGFFVIGVPLLHLIPPEVTLKYTEKYQVKVTLRLTVSQSVILGVEHHLGLMTRYLVLFDSYGLVFLWGALSDERTGLSFVRVIACISKSFVIM
jgi:hypothetical protein